MSFVIELAINIQKHYSIYSTVLCTSILCNKELLTWLDTEYCVHFLYNNNKGALCSVHKARMQRRAKLLIALECQQRINETLLYCVTPKALKESSTLTIRY